MKYRWDDVSEHDVDTIARIEKDSFIDPWTYEMFLEAMKCEYFVFKKLTLDNKIIGFLCYQIIAFEEAHIASIAIERNSRGHGLSKQMFIHFFKDLQKQEIRSATLEVRESNDIALNLYKSIGFKCAGIRPKYYLNGENAIIMWIDMYS